MALKYQQQNPEEYFNLLLANELNSLYRMACRYTRNKAQAEDLVHDTALRALRFQQQFAKGTNFKAWLSTILTNTFIHQYRRLKREQMFVDKTHQSAPQQAGLVDAWGDLTYLPEHAYHNKVLGKGMLRAVNQLPSEFRDVVILCDLEYLSYEAAAVQLGCPVGTVMSRLHRARRCLERQLLRLALDYGIGKKRLAHSLSS